MNGRMARGTIARRWLVLAGGVLTLLALGGVFAGWASWRQDRWMRDDLQYQTRIIAQTLNLSQIQRLHGNASDEENPEYHRLKGQLMAVQQVNPHWKWIYLMGRTTNGTVFFQVDSEAYNAPDASPPGQTYEEASELLQSVFDKGQAESEGPVADRWGIWVSAFEPLTDSRTGELVTVVGIDIDASLWAQLRTRAMKFPLLCCGLLVAIFLLGAFMLARRARIGSCTTWFCPYIEAFLVSATGLTLTVAAIWLTLQNELRNREIAFRHLARIETEPVADAASGLHNLELEGFGAFFENSEEVTSKEFRRYAAHLSGISAVQSWSWVEAVEATDRARFEEYTLFRTGKLGYQIWEKDEQGLPTTANQRDVYYPIVYMSPKKGNQPALGFDVGSDSNRFAAVITADQTHLPAASDPVPLINDPEGDQGIFLVRAIFRTNDPGRLQGFVAADLNIKSWLQTSRSGNPNRQPMATLDLFKLPEGQPPLWLASTDPQEKDHALHFRGAPDERTIRPLLVFGKVYAIVAHPTPAFRALHPTTTAWWVGLAGLIITASLAWVIGWFTHRRETLARMLDEQHHELASNMRRYDLLARQSRTFTWQTDANGLYTDLSRVVMDVLGYAPEELIGRKCFYDLHPDEGREEFMALAFDAFARRQPFIDLVNPLVAKSGDIVWVSTNGMPILDADGTLVGYQGTDKDITERKRAEDDLRFQAQLLNCVSEAITASDLEGRIQYWNHESERLYGYMAEEVLGRPYREFGGAIPPPDEESFRREVLDNGFWRGEHLQRKKDGSTFWTDTFVAPVRDSHGQPTGFIGIDQDITERKRAEESLARLSQQNKEAADRYAALISASNTGAWEYHDDTAHLWASSEYFAMLGRQPSDFDLTDGQANIEATWLDLLHPDDKEQARQYFVDYLKHPEGMYQHAFRMRHADGHWAWILSRGRMLRDAHGQPTPVVVGTHIDITESKRTEQALRESEQKFRTLFDEMLEGFAVHEILCDEQGHPVDYRFLNVNPAFERMTGLKAEDILGKTVLEVMPLTERHWIETYGHVALTGEAAFFQNFTASLGKHFEVTAFRPAPRQFACIFSDVTDRIRAENELRESRRQYAALLANLPGMAYRCQNDRFWTMDFVSAGCQALTGYAPEDLLGNKNLSFNDLILPPYRERLWEKWQKILQEHGKFEDEYEITTRTGEIKWVWEQGEGVYAEDGQILALEGFISDISERKRSEAERDRLTRAIEQSRETVVITDANGSIFYVNPAFTRSTGYSREEVLGRNPRLLQSGQHDASFYRKMWKTLGSGDTWEGQIVNKRKDGSLYTEQASISPVRDVAGHIIHFVAVKHDITQELQSQKEKEHLQVQLVQAQKMESIGRLAGGVAHDFNNMLQAILGYTEMAIEQVEPGQALHTDLQEIQKAAQRSASLTRQLQAFARRQISMPRVLDLNEAVEGMSSMLRRLIGEKIALSWNPGPHVGRVKIDPSQLDQILANLCINARDAIAESGHIVIETRNAEINRPVRPMPGDLPPGAYVRLSICDDGTGMAPEVIEHLFEPFFTTKQPGKGTGLGLATVYGIVKQNHGEIRVHSEHGKGTSFHIYLPRQTSQADPLPVNEDAEPLSRGHETILLVEDEQTILHAARRILESLGYEVLSTSSPKEASHLAETHKGRIHLLLTDVIMPELNGPDLVRRLQKDYPRLPYLYMSGYTANLIAEQGVNEDSAHFIPKPFTRKALAQKVREAIDES